jgi:hypothetical protein
VVVVVEGIAQETDAKWAEWESAGEKREGGEEKQRAKQGRKMGEIEIDKRSRRRKEFEKSQRWKCEDWHDEFDEPYESERRKSNGEGCQWWVYDFRFVRWTLICLRENGERKGIVWRTLCLQSARSVTVARPSGDKQAATRNMCWRCEQQSPMCVCVEKERKECELGGARLEGSGLLDRKAQVQANPKAPESIEREREREREQRLERMCRGCDGDGMVDLGGEERGGGLELFNSR